VTYILIGICALVLVAGIAAYLFRKKPVGSGAANRPPLPASSARAAQGAHSVADSDSPPPSPLPVGEMPADLAEFRLVRADELPDGRKQALIVDLRRIPRPPRSLHQLLSPEFVNSGTSIELSDLVMGEPHIAAKVLATVNSPFYALQKPVASVGQAVTFLGLNAVRGLCLQYMLDDSFKADGPELKKIYQTIWDASAIASELCFRLAQKLAVAEQGALVTQVVLSFFGHLATPSLMSRDSAASMAGKGLLERTQAEQEALGLGAAEIGSLLMQEWALPPSIIEAVRDVDRVMVTPADERDSRRGMRLAVCYLCARLGERLAQGGLTDLATFDPAAERSADFFHLRSYLDRAELARLVEYLHSPDLVAVIHRMTDAISARR
jgi:HD-like signal output (HDOD) protein